VDTWRGDEHTDAYDESVYMDVLAHNESRYSGFSELLRMRFEEALDRFDDESIDLLHIDGYHTYEAIKGDFESWYPKVRPGGVILLHDVVARLLDFGAWRYWSELAPTQETFLFKHGFGLGVLRKPGANIPDRPLLQMLFSSDESVRARLRVFYTHASEHHELRRKHARLVRMRRAADSKT
jgi:hypothetical protein